MIFDKLRGQQDAKRLLTEQATSGRISHAYIFCGAEGIGKFSLAEGFARMIMCRDPGEDGAPCGKCKSCLMHDSGTNPDLKVVDLPQGKASIPIDYIRELNGDALTAPLYSKRKVYIVRHCDAMTVEAQNALLKTLEEPPQYVVILLLCSNISVMLPTIISRTARLDLARYNEEEIKLALSDRGLEARDMKAALSYSDGIIGRAIDFLSDPETEDIRAKVLEAAEGLPGGDAGFRLKSANYIGKMKDKKELVFFTLLGFYRDKAVDARYGSGSGGDYYNAQRCVEIVEKAWLRIRQNTNYDLAVSNMLIQLQEVLK